jgi:hypothetical protein
MRRTNIRRRSAEAIIAAILWDYDASVRLANELRSPRHEPTREIRVPVKGEHNPRDGATIANDVRKKLDPVLCVILDSACRKIRVLRDRRRLKDDVLLESPEQRNESEV